MLPKKNRVDKKLMQKIFKDGHFVGSRVLSFKHCLNNTTYPKISFVVPKKVEKSAVKRNSLRRRGYLVLEKYFNKLPQGLSGVFVFNKSLTVSEIEDEIKKILSKIN